MATRQLPFFYRESIFNDIKLSYFTKIQPVSSSKTKKNGANGNRNTERTSQDKEAIAYSLLTMGASIFNRTYLPPRTSEFSSPSCRGRFRARIPTPVLALQMEPQPWTGGFQFPGAFPAPGVVFFRRRETLFKFELTELHTNWVQAIYVGGVVCRNR